MDATRRSTCKFSSKDCSIGCHVSKFAYCKVTLLLRQVGRRGWTVGRVGHRCADLLQDAIRISQVDDGWVDVDVVYQRRIMKIKMALWHGQIQNKCGRGKKECS